MATDLTRTTMTLEAAAFAALRHFRHLDESNAAIHLGNVRFSPITFQLARALVDHDRRNEQDPDVAQVLSHDGSYEWDMGR
jgi:hypothetical protein